MLGLAHHTGAVKWVGIDAMIDWTRVEDLRTEIGSAGLAEVADMFLDEADQAVTALMSGLPEAEIEGQLHFLKGSALNLGLTDLAAVCQDGERKAAAGHGVLIDMARVEEVYQMSRARLLAGIASGPIVAGSAA